MQSFYHESRIQAMTLRDVGIAPYGKCPVVGVGVLDDPAECTDLTTNPRRIRTAPRVGGDDLGAPFRTPAEPSARCGHRALREMPHRRGRRPRRPSRMYRLDHQSPANPHRTPRRGRRPRRPFPERLSNPGVLLAPHCRRGGACPSRKRVRFGKRKTTPLADLTPLAAADDLMVLF